MLHSAVHQTPVVEHRNKIALEPNGGPQNVV
nr:MAG TPA: hypothetical protein [Caudoviricetes sp.]